MKRWISSGAADAVQKAAILLDAGADISARDEEYRSTPLAWAARTGAVRDGDVSPFARGPDEPSRR